jgi:hypothetical protein
LPPPSYQLATLTPVLSLPDIVLALDVFRKGWLFASCAKVRSYEKDESTHLSGGEAKAMGLWPIVSPQPLLSPGSEHPDLEDE